MAYYECKYEDKEMITNDLMSSIVSLSIFILGVATRRYGLAGLLVMLTLLIDICVTHADNPFPYGSVVSIALFVALIICHGKSTGKQSPLYQYSPYTPNSRMPTRIKLLLLLVAAFATLVAILSLLLDKV